MKKWICLLACTTCLYSQPYTIKVLDSVSTTPLPYVPVLVGGQTFLTDEKGIANLDTCNLKVQIGAGFSGYLPTERTVPCQRETLTIYLVPALSSLAPLVLNIFREPLPYEKVPASVSVISREEQLLHPDISPMRAVQQVSGVEVTGKQVTVRGMSGWAYGVGSRVRLLIDGLPLVMSDAGDVKWFLMPSLEAQQIEFIKGGASAMYGSAALDGIISITTLEPEQEGIGATARAWVQLTGTPPQKSWQWWDRPPTSWRGELLVWAKHGRMAEVASADIINKTGYRQGEDERRHRFFAKLIHMPTKRLRYSLSVQFLENSASEMFFWASPDSPYTPANGTLIYSSLKQRLIDPRIEWLTPTTLHSLKLRLLHTQRQHAVTTHQLDYSIHWKHHNTERLTTIAGIYLERGAVDSSDLYPTNHTTFNIAPYLQINTTHRIDSSRSLRLFVSTRIERYQIDTLTPWLMPLFRLGMSVEVAGNLHLRASLGEGIRFPTVAELFTFSQKAGLWLLPNPKLEPEQGWTADFGVFYRTQALKRTDISLEGTLFFARFQNMVEYSYVLEWIDPSTLVGGFKPDNTEQGTVYGAEAELLATYLLPDGNVKLRAGLTRIEPLNNAWKKGMSPETRYLKFRYRWMGKASVEIQWRFILTGAYYRYHSPMLRIDPSLYFVVPRLSEYMASHCVCVSDLSVFLGVGLPNGLKLIFYISNVLNTPYMYLPGNIASPLTYNLMLIYNYEKQPRSYE